MQISGQQSNNSSRQQSNNNITAIVQNQVVNNFIHLNKTHALQEQSKQSKARPKGKIEALKEKQSKGKITFKNNDVIFSSPSFEVCNEATKQVFLYALIALTKQLPHEHITEDQANKYVNQELDLNDYCETRGIKHKKTARKTIINSLEKLSECSFKYSYTKYGKNHEEEKYIAQGGILTLHKLTKSTNPTAEVGYWQNGRVKISLTPSFVLFMSNDGKHVMPFYKPLLMINTRVNPYSVNLGYKLQTHRFMNNGKKNQNTISIEALLNECDFNLDNKHRTKLVRTPFERDLDKLQELGIIQHWEYCNSNKEPVTDEQLLGFSNFDKWKDLFINFELVDYPEIKRNRKKKKSSKATDKV